MAKYKKVVNDLKRAKGKYPKFHLVFISKSVNKSLLKTEKIGNVQYEGWDINKLIGEILGRLKTAVKLRPLHDMLETEVNPLPSSVPNGAKPITLPKQIPPTVHKGELYIERRDLINELFDFTQDDNGLITGGPGYGKSFMIAELQRHYHKHKIPCFAIRINELVTGSVDELNRELGTTSNWLDALKHVSIGKEHPLLIFDGFDTAKEETFKVNMLTHVKSAIKTLRAHWRIVVSTRSYDARKSLKLTQLFPKAKRNGDVDCRHTDVPALTDLEVVVAVGPYAVMKRVYSKANGALKELLRIPYFLELFKLVASEKEVINVQTEEQLLTLYWKTRIAIDTSKDLFLRKLTAELSAKESLSCKKSLLITEQNAAIFDVLLSDGIIVETSYTNENIAFAHNILLEYDLFRYEIPFDVDELIQYMNSNERRPFLFRSSFIYFYSTLWTHNRELFWKHYFALKKIPEPLFRLVHQTILNYVLAYFFEKTADIDVVLQITDEEDRSATIRKILEATRYVRSASLATKDLQLMLNISKNITPSVVWDLGLLISKAIEQYSGKDIHHRTLGQISKNYLTYYLSALDNPVLKGRVEGNALQWSIRNYMHSYAFISNPQKLIRQLLRRLSVIDFNIHIFDFIAEEIVRIGKCDMPFALEIYKTVYNHKEKSDVETIFNNSVVVNFKSSRRQHYGMVRHRLEEQFEQLLQLNIVESVVMAISIIDSQLLNENSYRSKFYIEELLVNHQTVTVVDDWATYEHNTDGQYGLLSHAHRIEKALDHLILKGETEKVNEVLTTFLQHAKSSTLWLRLIDILTKHPIVALDIIGNLLSQVGIYKFEKIREQTGKLIGAVWSYLDITQKENIEKAIFAIPLLAYHDETMVTTLKARLYSKIPVGEITLKSSVDLLNIFNLTGNQENEDAPVTFHDDFSIDSEKEWLGMREDVEAEQEAFRLLKHIDEFVDSHTVIQNGPLRTAQKYGSYLPSAKKLFELRSKSFPTKLLRQCDRRICEFADKVLGNFKAPDGVRKWIAKVAFFYIDCESYLGTVEHGTPAKHHDAMSDSPRFEATSILSKLFIKYNDSQARNKLLHLMRDNTQYVRLKSIGNLPRYYKNFADIYWSKLEEIFGNETDSLCLKVALNAMHYKDVREKDWEKVVKMLWLVNDRIHAEKATEDLERKFATLLMSVLLNHDCKSATNCF